MNVFKYIFLVLLLSGCNLDQCEMGRGANAFMGKPDYQCIKNPIDVCKKQCNGYLNTIITIGNVTNIYTCSCDNK